MEQVREYPIEFELELTESQLKRMLPYFPKDETTGGYGGFKWNEETMTALFSVRMAPFLMEVFSRTGIEWDYKELFEKYSFKNEIDCSSQDFLRDEQYEVMKKACSKNSGIIQCRTGWGKGTFMTYMLKHYKGDGNILILAPMLSVLDELKDRGRQYGIEYGDRIRTMHAAGFMNSGEKENKATIEWLSNVDLVLVDELENVPSTLESLLRDFCTSYRFLYGFSATANKYQHMELTWDKINFASLHPETVKILYYFGQSLAFKLSSKSLIINKVWGKMNPEVRCYYKGDHYNFTQSVEGAIRSPGALELIFKVAEKTKGVLLIPVKNQKQGEYFLDAFKETSIKAAFWKSGSIKTTDNVVSKQPIKDYLSLKEAVDNCELEVLICTSLGYRGVDFQTVNDIVLLVGTNNSVVNQIVGRGERNNDDLNIWMLFNESDRDKDYRNGTNKMETPIFNACNGSRIKQMTSSHEFKIKEHEMEFL